jgi:hypothetical protein
MLPVLLFAGVLLLLIGAASLGAGPAASSRPLRAHSTRYGWASVAGGVVVVAVAAAGIALGW